MRDVDPSLRIAMETLRDLQGWFWFVEVTLRLTPTTLRAVTNTEPVEAAGIVWPAASMRVEVPEETDDGSIGEALISVPNVSRLPIAYVEKDDEILGQPVAIYAQHESRFGSAFDPNLSWPNLKALSAEVTELQINFECGHAAELIQVPTKRFTRAEFPQLLRTTV